MGETTIAWTERVWNPLRGCSRISPGCENCYAERMCSRSLPELKSPTTGEDLARRTPSGPRWTGRVELIEEALDIPLRRRKPTTYFVNSMSDVFHESVPDETIDRIFAVMALCPQHTFQVLTKRAGRMQQYFRDKGVIGGDPENNLYGRILACANTLRHQRPELISIPISNPARIPLRNVWLGVSVEDQQRADERIPHLLRTPAAVRFVSAEPLLGPVDLDSPDLDGLHALGCGDSECKTRDVLPGCHGLDWVIVGGESGPGSRPCDAAWIRSIVRQCAEAAVPCFVKQLGAYPVVKACRQHHWDFGGEIGRKARFSPVDKLHPSTGLWRVHLSDRKGGDPAEWPLDLRVREVPR